MTTAAALGAWSLGFGLPFLFRPDEDVMVGRAVRMAAEHSLDPLFANYPPLGFYLLASAEAVLSLLLGRPLGPSTTVDPTAEFLAARAVSVIAFVAGTGFVYLAGSRAYGRPAGALAAAALALSPLAVRQAHFATADGLAMALVGASLWAALRAQGRRGFVLAGALCGLAAATKYTAGSALVAVLVLAALGADRRGRAAWAVAGAGLVFAAVMASAGHPLDYFRGLLFLGRRAGESYSTTIGFVQHSTASLPFGLGLGSFALALAGAAAAAVRRRPADVSLLAFTIAYALIIGFSHEAFFRYVMPILPALCLFAGGLAQAVPARLPVAAVAAGAVALMLPSAYASLQTDRLLGATDTRRQSADWLLRNAPAGSEVRIDSYWGQPFYDAHEVQQDRLLKLYITGDWTADSFEPGRYTERFRINRQGTPCYTVLESGPPWQSPPPGSSAAPAAVFLPYAGSPPEHAVYDPLDSFYLPIWGFDSLQRPGPSVVIVEGCP